VLSAGVGVGGGGCGGGGTFSGSTGSSGSGGGKKTSWLVGNAGALLSQEGEKLVSRDSHTNIDLFSIYCVDRVHGWVSGAAGLLLRSSDGGASWNPSQSGTEVPLRATAFADVSVGVAAGDSGTIVRSDDGGATWTAVSSGTTQTLRAAAFTRDQSLALIVGDNGTILRSIDGGKSFAPATGYDAPVSTSWVAVKLAADGKLGFLAGAGGELRVTRDGGATWSDLANAPGNLHGLTVTGDGSRVIAVGDGGLVWKSLDQGATWAQPASGTSSALNAIGFAEDDDQAGWAVGNDSTVLATDDGAKTFYALASPIVANFSGVEDF
jgi:photosystem II stability/assembly factor-like uncharacterized protein